MATLITLLALTTGVGVGYYVGSNNIYGRFKNLVGVLQSVQDKGPVYNVLSGVGVVAKSAILKTKNFCKSYVNTYTKKVDKKSYDIHYCIRNKNYVCRTKVMNGPNPITSITNESGKDITNDILPYMGPNLDFHKHEFTPSDFNYKSITIFFNDGNQKKIENKELIQL